jgi:hypothetical protein
MKYVFNAEAVLVGKVFSIITFGQRCGLDSQAFGHGWTIQMNDMRSAGGWARHLVHYRVRRDAHSHEKSLNLLQLRP